MQCLSESKLGVEDKILQSARKLFVLKGYHATSIPDIVKDSDTSTGAIYHHFKNKRDLSDVVYDRTRARFSELCEIEVFSASSASERVNSYVQLVFRLTEEDPYFISYLNITRAPKEDEKGMALCSREGLKVIRRIMQEGHEEGVLQGFDIDVASGMMCGAVGRLISMRLDGLLDSPLPKIADSVASSVSRMLFKMEATAASLN